MNRPSDPGPKPTEPVRPERTTIKNNYETHPIKGSLKDLVTELTAKGIDLAKVEITTKSDRWGDHEGYYAEWLVQVPETQNDSMWRVTQDRYAEKVAAYQKALAKWEVDTAEYARNMPIWEQSIRDSDMRAELYQLARLKAKYPNA